MPLSPEIQDWLQSAPIFACTAWALVIKALSMEAVSRARHQGLSMHEGLITFTACSRRLHQTSSNDALWLEKGTVINLNRSL